jgi:gluconate 2-dehydrogenase gamma chain
VTTRGVSRRVVVRIGAAFSALGGLVPARAFAEIIRGRLRWVVDVIERPPRRDERPGYIFFSPAEAAFVEAAAARMIPSDSTGPGAAEAEVPRFIDRQLAGPYGEGDRFYLQPPFPKGTATQGWQMGPPATVYRASIAAVDRWAGATFGRPFAALDPATQDEALKALEDGKADLGETADAKAFFALLLQNVVEGYFADPVYGGNRDMSAWAMIGFPGARYDLTQWVSRYGEVYTLPPVGLTGRSAWKPRS